MLAEQTDIAIFLQKFRQMKNKVDLKIKLDHHEKQYVRNNKYYKLHVSTQSDSDASPVDSLSPTKTITQEKFNKLPIHEREASSMFSKGKAVEETSPKYRRQ